MSYWQDVTDHGDILDIAGDWLTEAGLRLVVDTDNAHRYQVWDRAERDYGPDVALIHAPADEGRLGPEFRVSWNYRYPHHARIVVDAFTKAGCEALWGGTHLGAVQVKVRGAR